LLHADAFTHKLPDEAIKNLKHSWNVATPEYQLHSLPCDDIFIEKNVEYGQPYKIVFAGGIMPPQIALDRGHENHILFPLIFATAESNVELKFYVNQNARNMFWDEQKQYFEFENRYSHFQFIRGVPFFKLPEKICDNHFGLLYDNLQLSSYNLDAYKYNMSTKVFSYIEAGLPILVYDDLNYIANFVKANGLGIVYNAKKIQEIPELLESADYKKLKQNVLMYRSTNSINSCMDVFIKAYHPQTGGSYGKASKQ
jgi:hypothetical protein